MGARIASAGDIFINFRTALQEKGTRDDVIIDNAIIAKSYATGWLAVDICSCLPVNWVELIVATDNQTDGDSDSRSLRVLRAFRLFRLTKMLRLFRMKRILGRFQAFYKQKSKILSTLHMMKIIVFLLYSGHIMACIFYAVGSPSMDEDSEDDEVGWVQRYHFASNTTGIDVSAEPAWFSLYITSFFLSITNEAVTVASTNAEKAYVSAQFLLYTLLVAYLTGTFASVIMQHNVSKQKFVTKINELREFMEKRRIPEEMRERINTFYDEVYEREGFYNEDELLADLPPQVSTALSDDGGP